MISGLHPREVNGGRVEQTAPGCFRLSIPAGDDRQYRCAQLDDYIHLPRQNFPWKAVQQPKFTVRMRVSAAELPGTWGFGLWNDPFGLTFATRGRARRLPTLPQTAWFFYASPHNHLALHDNHPASGFLAATFASKRIPPPLIALGLPVLPLLFWQPAARLLRSFMRRFVQESAALVPGDVTAWRACRIEFCANQVLFSLDDQPIAASQIIPRGPLGFVLWIDNQFAAFPSDGRVSMGALANPAAWLEVEITQELKR